MKLLTTIDKNKIPQHIAIIMDGNGRWAKEQGLPRVIGHQHGAKTVRTITEASAKLGVKYLTMYAFSTENWNRPLEEVQALMSLLVKNLRDELPTLHENQIKLNAIGGIWDLPKECYLELVEVMQATEHHTRMTLTLALNYSGKWDIINAVKKIANQVVQNDVSVDDIDEQLFQNALSTNNIPEPELLIRTSGECRISNFLLWQLAYTEFYFTPVLWPDFNKEHFFQAIIDYQNRERRFGGILES